MALIGDIALRARGEIPETWDALARSTTYGDMQLQFRVDYTKFMLFATVVDQSLEATIYSPAQLMLAGKRVALAIIPGGADWWSNQYVQEVARGTDETRTFPDRIASLWRIHARLLQEVGQLETIIPGLTPTKRGSVPSIDTTGPYLTPDPNAFGAYGVGSTTFPPDWWWVAEPRTS